MWPFSGHQALKRKILLYAKILINSSAFSYTKTFKRSPEMFSFDYNSWKCMFVLLLTKGSV